MKLPPPQLWQVIIGDWRFISIYQYLNSFHRYRLICILYTNNYNYTTRTPPHLLIMMCYYYIIWYLVFRRPFLLMLSCTVVFYSSIQGGLLWAESTLRGYVYYYIIRRLYIAGLLSSAVPSLSWMGWCTLVLTCVVTMPTSWMPWRKYKTDQILLQ